MYCFFIYSSILSFRFFFIWTTIFPFPLIIFTILKPFPSQKFFILLILECRTGRYQSVLTIVIQCRGSALRLVYILLGSNFFFSVTFSYLLPPRPTGNIGFLPHCRLERLWLFQAQYNSIFSQILYKYADVVLFHYRNQRLYLYVSPIIHQTHYKTFTLARVRNPTHDWHIERKHESKFCHSTEYVKWQIPLVRLFDCWCRICCKMAFTCMRVNKNGVCMPEGKYTRTHKKVQLFEILYVCIFTYIVKQIYLCKHLITKLCQSWIPVQSEIHIVCNRCSNNPEERCSQYFRGDSIFSTDCNIVVYLMA